VAGAAFLRGVWQKGIVGVMARHTGFAGIMKLNDNLWESGRPGGVVTVTEGTVPTPPRRAGSELVRRLHMPGGRPVAGLTRYPLMVRFSLQFINIIVAVNACLIASITDLLSGDLQNRISAIVPVPPE